MLHPYSPIYAKSICWCLRSIAQVVPLLALTDVNLPTHVINTTLQPVFIPCFSTLSLAWLPPTTLFSIKLSLSHALLYPGCGYVMLCSFAWRGRFPRWAHMFVLKLLSTYLRRGVHCWPKCDGEKSKIDEFGGERTTWYCLHEWGLCYP